MNNNIVIQPMTMDDMASVCNVWKQSGLIIKDYQKETYELEMVLRTNPHTCFVAKAGNDIVGSVLGASNGRRVWIYHLAVLPKWQDKGIGSKLLNSVEMKVKQQGATKVLLGVFWENLKVLPFYEKQGFTAMMDMLILEKNLHTKGGEIV